MKLNKSIFSAAVLLCAGALVIGCGKKVNTEAQPEQPAVEVVDTLEQQQNRHRPQLKRQQRQLKLPRKRLPKPRQRHRQRYSRKRLKR